MFQTWIIVEDWYDTGLLQTGSVQVQTDKITEVGERMIILRSEEMTVAETEMCEIVTEAGEIWQDSSSGDVTVVQVDEL